VDDSLSLGHHGKRNGQCIQTYSCNTLKILFKYSPVGRKILEIYACALACDESVCETILKKCLSRKILSEVIRASDKRP